MAAVNELTYEISGTVRGSDGQPVSGATVIVWWQHIRDRTQMTSGQTAANGTYDVRYAIPSTAPLPMLLVVEARITPAATSTPAPGTTAPAAAAKPVAATIPPLTAVPPVSVLPPVTPSPTTPPPIIVAPPPPPPPPPPSISVFSLLTPAEPALVIDLTFAPQDQSEWALIVGAITPLLETLKLTDLVENSTWQDLTFLSRETSRNTGILMQVALSARLEATFSIPAPAWYAFLRQHVPAALPEPLLEASQDFTLIDALLQNVASLIFALSPDVQTSTLTAAIALNLIGPQFTAQIKTLVAAFAAHRVTDLLNRPYLVGNTTLSQLLTAVSLTTDKQQIFSQALATNTLPMRTFWKNLAIGKSGLTAQDASSIERVISIGAFVKNHAPLVQALEAQFSSGKLTALPQLAKMSLADWTALVKQVGAPPGIDAAGAADPVQVFASVVYARVTRAYPTAALASRIPQIVTAQAQQQPIATFFTNNPSLELTKENLTVYLETKGAAAFQGISTDQQAAVVAAARGMQRVLRMNPNVDVAQNVMKMGINSASQVAVMGRQQFYQKATGVGLTKTEANQTYEKAAQRYANVVSMYMSMNIDAQGVLPKAVGNLAGWNQPVAQAAKRDQSIATLFGSQDYCAIEDCTSVLSAAAYLCDLLLWLRNHPQGGHTALDVLDGRRPDIRHLLLNCPNTDTELPYVDLVNELLADKISPPTDPNSTINPIWKQTSESATAAELSAAPEYFNQPAYIKLFSASYPQTLPYSAGLDELRTYLQQWHLPLWQLRQALLPLAGGTVAQQAAVAAERLGMNVQAESLVTTPNFVTPQVAWNTNDFSATAPNGLATVPVFLEASSLTYDSLLELLEVSWVQGGLSIKLTGLNDSCDTSAMALQPAPLDAGFLDRAHRFLRLWLATGYKMWELNLLLNAPSVGAGSLNQQTLVNLQSFWQVQSLGKLAVNQLLAFYQNIDTAEHRDPDRTTALSLYEQIFLNPTVTWAAPDPDMVSLPAGGAIGDTVLSDHGKAIQPALGVSAADLATLIGLTNNTLTLANLSLMYRVNLLAKASKFTIPNLITVATLLNPAAANATAALAPLLASPAATLAFLQQAPNIQKAGLSLDALPYLLTPPAPVSVVATTTLAGPITAAQTSITVANDAGFPAPNFFIHIGAEILQVTGVSGAGNTVWNVVRGQQGTVAASASNGAAVTPAGNGGWNTTTQMTPANIATTLAAVQQAVVQLMGASTTLTGAITAGQTSITVASDANFPATSFYVYIGSEILQVTATGGTGNTTWTVVRGQLGTTAAAAPAGAAVTPTSGDLDGVVTLAVAANGHTLSGTPLANDVTALILKTLQAPGTGKTLLAVLEDPALVAPSGTITIGGTPAAGDQLQAVISSVSGTVAVSYTLVAGDAGDANQTALHFAQAINASPAVTGANKFLAPASAAGAMITLTALTPGAPGSNVTSANTAVPAGASGTTVTPASTVLNGVPVATQANFPAQFTAVQLFDKAAVLVRGLKLVATDLGWLLANAGVYGGCDFGQLPVIPSQPPVSLNVLLTTLLLIKLVRTFTSAPQSSAIQTLYDVISGVHTGSLGTAAQAQSALATVTGWPVTDIEAFAPALALTYPASYLLPQVYASLRTLESMSAAVNAAGPVASPASTSLVNPIDGVQTSLTVKSAIGFPAPNFYVSIGAEILLVTTFGGADNTSWTVVRAQQGTTGAPALAGAAVTPTYGAQIVSWGGSPPDEVSAESLAASALGVLKAQQPDEPTWLSLAPSLMNPIRDRRSAALRSYLTAQRDGSGNLIYEDDDALFDYFLIDVQMTSCQVTSRIVQAYIAVQIFVERCLMNLETTQWGATTKGVVVDLTQDDTWNQWEWMKRYRVWEANREVFLYPENWLIESQRPSRTEIYQKLEQEVHQGQSTADYLETVVLNYIDRLDGLSHLLVTGTCEDPATGNIYVVARTLADPATFYIRTYSSGAWTGWTQIPLDVKAHQAIPAMYRGRVCLFWIEIKISNEPQQVTPAAQPNSNPPHQKVDRFAAIGVNFSMFRNGSWAPVQSAKGKLFDKPIFDSTQQAGDVKSVEALYTMKVQQQAAAPGLGAPLFLDIFRLGVYTVKNMYNEPNDPMNYQVTAVSENAAVHLGRAVFDGHFSDLELNNFEVPGLYPDNVDYAFGVALLQHAKQTYGPDAKPLLPLTAPDPNLTGDSNLLPFAGALAGFPGASGGQTVQLNFTVTSGLDQNAGPLITAPLPVRVVGPSSDFNFDPTNYFFYQDNRRCYYVETPKYYWTGSFFSPNVPSDPSQVPYEVLYKFHPFYHPFTRLMWNQLGAGGFDLLYDPQLQQSPDTVDPSYPDVFSFKQAYQPTWRVQWDLANAGTTLAANISNVTTSISVVNPIWVPQPPFQVQIGAETLNVTGAGGANRTLWTVQRAQSGTAAASHAQGTAVTPLTVSQDRQFMDFSTNGAFSVYNWELFYHIPLYIAQMLSQNQQFEDALTWFQYIFNPTRQGTDPTPQRFWITKPLHDLTSADIIAEQINKLLLAVNQNDPNSVNQIRMWRQDPFNPFLLADLRPVAYMKSTVMSYLDNLIAWADNLFASESREALSEATLIYVIADEILGPTPQAVTPPPHSDMSYDQLEPSLDAFANAMVEIENLVGPDAGVISIPSPNGNMPSPQTFYFKIPPNDQLLGYWTTVADRLYKLRHCQNISGGALVLALFDAPINPGLLIAAQAAGVDLNSVLSAIGASLPNYRFTTLYSQASDFVNAVRAYGSSLQAAIEKSDAGALTMLQQTTALQLLQDGDQVLDWQVQQAQANLDALGEALNLNQAKYDFNNSQSLANAAEIVGTTLHTASGVLKVISAATTMVGAVAASIPNFTFGAAGFGGSPVATLNDGGGQVAKAGHMAGISLGTVADIVEIGAQLSNTIGSWMHRKDNWDEAAKEAQISIAQTQQQIQASQFALAIAQQNQITHQEQIDNSQKQIDFLSDKFTNNSLYDWMVSALSAIYFQSYQLAWQMCRQVERCYQFELGIQNSSFIQFGYWDSLHKGLLAGETLNHDLRRMQASYLQQNARRYELSRYVSLGILAPNALQSLLVKGSCDFTIPETLFDNDYPGHYNRRLTRASLTVVYPNPGKYDNVKATLTLVSNKVRVRTDSTAGYEESPVGSDPRFIYAYAANSQKIAMGNAQDDPGLFISAIASNIADQRYLPFENAGAISSWHLEMNQINNEVDLGSVGDVIIHLYYTALDGGQALHDTVQAFNLANLPTSGVKIFSAQNDFAAPGPTVANPYPVSPWSAFLTAGAPQVLTLSMSALKFPPWTRGKTISVSSLTLLAVAWPPGNLVLAPQAPLPTAQLTMAPVAGVTEPNVCAATIALPAGTPLGKWSFEIQQQGAPDFQSLTKDMISDVILMVQYAVS
ncbi:MAG TPA: neuraminidase-like domain-containing protein [Bryobacteraceae bacterium]|nr:neuraminidase-like domain-containing protein [Bryobacteraceae bacterium]